MAVYSLCAASERSSFWSSCCILDTELDALSISRHLYNHVAKWTLSMSLFKWGCTERLSNLPEITQLNGWAGIQARCVCLCGFYGGRTSQKLWNHHPGEMASPKAHHRGWGISARLARTGRRWDAGAARCHSRLRSNEAWSFLSLIWPRTGKQMGPSCPRVWGKLSRQMGPGCNCSCSEGLGLGAALGTSVDLLTYKTLDKNSTVRLEGSSFRREADPGRPRANPGDKADVNSCIINNVATRRKRQPGR